MARAAAWFEQKYITGAIHALQSEGFLTKGMTSMNTGQAGNEVTWKIVGRGEATEMSEGIENRPTLNADRATQKATMVPIEANDWINVTDLAQMSEAEISIAQQTCAWAMGRAFDRRVFRALDADASIAQIGTGAANLDLVQVLEGQAGVMSTGTALQDQCWVAVPFRVMAGLMLIRGFASADYVQGSPLMKKIGARHYLGMNFVPFPDEYFSIPAANQWDAYMWMQSAVGYATATDDTGKIKMATRIDYVPEKKAHFAGNTAMGAAKTLLPLGIRRFRVSSNAALVSSL